MRVKKIPSDWLRSEGARLDVGPYMSGALEAKVLLEKLSARKDRLDELTAGHSGGIYNGPQFVRNYVNDPEHGVPFVSSGSMLRADLSTLPLLRKKDAVSKKLSYLQLTSGTTLISCSGAIGRMVFVREEMVGMWSSQDVLKVAADEGKIRPGYLYAYLAGKFGLPLVISGTYGAIIQHLEPPHIAGLPVPRLNERLEYEVDALVVEAANKRSAASMKIKEAVRLFEEYAGLPLLGAALSPTPYSARAVNAVQIQSRFDAFFHSDYHQGAIAAFAESGLATKTLGEIVDSVVEPPRFKRVAVDDPDFGVPFFGTSALMWAHPVPSYMLAKAQRNISQFIVGEETLLLPRSGQLSGVIGTAVLPYGPIIGGAVSEDAIRIHCPSPSVAGYLFVALSSQYCRRQLKARAFGSSIPHLDVHQIRQVLVPILDQPVREKIERMGVSVAQLRHEAIEHECEAREMVENAIEEAAA